MRNILKLMNRLNKWYDNFQQPHKFLLALSPMIIGFIISIIEIIFFDNVIYMGTQVMLVGSIIVIFGYLLLFRLPTFLTKDYINTYVIGSSVKFKNKITIKYLDQQHLEHISKWIQENLDDKYRGLFYPNNQADFYFKDPKDATMFKLKWY